MLNEGSDSLTDLEAVSEQNTTEFAVSGSMDRIASLQRQGASEFSRACRRARKAAARGKPELAVEWCRYAALLAWSANPGFYYSHDVEQILAEIGRKYLPSVPVAAPSAGPPLRFLHVMSTAYERGGHTRLVSRWIETCAEHTPSEQHSVLISMQTDDPLPAWLGQSARKTGGEIIELPPGLSWLQAAAEIRSRSLEFDAVILHIHPNDPLPNLAFFDQPRPVLFFKHADHVFSLGFDVSRVIADVRPVGQAMSVNFCAPAPRKVLLPLPLFDEGPTSYDKVDARRKLGLPEDALIVLTIGEPYKFMPLHEYNFSTVVQSLCAGNPRVLIIAIGLSESEPFPGLGRLVGGRFRPVGVVKDREILELYYRATDVYLDGIPCTSMTAVLDAAMHSLPIQRLYNPHSCLMWCDDPALDSVERGASTLDEVIAVVLDWLEWPEEKRLELGGRFRKAVVKDHCGASWKSTWLDPAVNALRSPGEDPLQLGQDFAQKKELGFPGLGVTGPAGQWHYGMFIAGIIGSAEYIPRPIRISAVFQSIRPVLFNSPSDGRMGKRLTIFKGLVSSCVPDQLRTVVRNMRDAIFMKRRHQRGSSN